LEREQADLGRRLADADPYRSDPEGIKTTTARHAEIETLLLQPLARWEYLEGKQPS
jgi:ABC transporter C-terminal domain